jgi:hypothetical protein
MANNIDIRLKVIEENTKAISQTSRDLRDLNDRVGKYADMGAKQTYQQKAAIRQERVMHRERVIALKEEMNLAKKSLAEQTSNAKKLSNIMLGLGFNLLFTGMAVQRLADGALRAIINTYSNAIGQTGEFNILTNRLAASWEYFKFSIVDALMQSGLLQTFLGWAQKGVNWFNELGPAAKQGIGIALFGLLVLGAIAQPVGMALLALSTTLQIMQMNPGLLTSMFRFATAAFVAAAAIAWLYAIFSNDDTNSPTKVLSAIGVAMLAVTGIALLMGATITAATLGILLGIGSALLVGIAFKEELGIGFSYLVDWAILLGGALIKFILLPLEAAVFLFNKIAKFFGMKKVSFTPFGLVDSAMDGMGAANNRRRNELIAERDARGNPLNNLGLGGLFGGPTSPVPGAIGPAASTPTSSASGPSVNYNIDNYWESQRQSSERARQETERIWSAY